MTLPEFLRRDEAGDVRLADHRIGLDDVVRLYNRGYSAEMIALELDSLPLATVHKVIGFYLEHQSEIDAHVAAIDRTLAQQAAAAPPQGPGLDELRRRIAHLKQAKAS